MINWKYEYKKQLIEKIKEITGTEISIDSIEIFELEIPSDYSSLSLQDLTHIYTFLIMKEEFEKANEILNILKNKNINVEFKVYDNKNGAFIFKKKRKKKNEEDIEIKMQIYPDGMIMEIDLNSTKLDISD